MDRVSVLDSNYCPSMAGTSCTGSIKPSDSVSHISSRRQMSGLSKSLLNRKKLDEPVVPASVRSMSRGSSRQQSARPRLLARSATSRSVGPAVDRQSQLSKSNSCRPPVSKSALQRQQLATRNSLARSGVGSHYSAEQHRAMSALLKSKNLSGSNNGAESNIERIDAPSSIGTRTCISTSTSDNVKLIETQIRKKLIGGHVYSLRALFKTHSTDILTSQTGVLSPVVMLSGLTKVLSSFLNMTHVSQKECRLLLQRLQLDPDKPLHFEMFYGRIRDGIPVGDYPAWLDPAKRRKEQFQEHTEALDKFKNMKLEVLEKVLPNLYGDAITRSDVRRALEYQGSYLNEVNFQKLWENITPKNSKGSVIPAKTLRIFLGIDAPETAQSQNNENNENNNSEINTEISTKTDASNKTLDRKRQERKLTIEIEKWLKDRFRKAFEALKVTFEEADRQIHHDQVTGTLTRSSFRACLGKYGLQLSNDEQLENFLARCGLWVGFCEGSFFILIFEFST